MRWRCKAMMVQCLEMAYLLRVLFAPSTMLKWNDVRSGRSTRMGARRDT